MLYRRLILNVFDAFLISIALILAFMLRFGFRVPGEYVRELLFLLPLTIAIKIPVFEIFNFHNQLWRYASLKEGLRLFNGISTASLLILSALFFVRRIEVPRAVMVIDWFLTLIIVGACYFIIRVVKEIFSAIAARGKGLKRVAIVGAGEVGSSLARQMQNHPEKGYKPIAFLDDDPSKKGLMIRGIKVVGGTGAISTAAARYRADEIVIAIPPEAKRERARIALECKEIGIPCKIAPSMIEAVDGKVRLSDMREVDPKELLGREEIGIDLGHARSCFENKVVLITGAAGSIGSELCHQVLALKPALVIASDFSENGLYELEQKTAARSGQHKAILETRLLDVRDVRAADRILSRFKPHIVFHAAAYKQVPMMERHALEVMENNFLGTRVMIHAAKRNLVERFVFISTDKAVNPRSIMGLSKQLGEKAIKLAARDARETKFIAVRFGNVLGSRGSVVHKFKSQIRDRQPVTVTHPDSIRFFMTVQEAVHLVVQATAIGASGEIYALDMGDPVKILDLAKSMIRLSGYEPGKDIPIDFIGLRPGEKLCEDLIAKDEKMVKTSHPKILKVVGLFDPERDGRLLDEIEAIIRGSDEVRLRELVREMWFDRAMLS